IADRINDRMKLSLLVIDEAHYIKNPDARRSAAVRLLEDEADRILLMTGTPVENRVEEMCSLIGFIRPDMAGRVRELAYMKQIPQFREFLSPVYLRRQRDHVLKELPPVEEKQEWCMMSMTDLAWYTASVMSKNFTDMRRVSFHQEDLSTSSKAVRILEICREAVFDERKVVIYSYFRETIRKISALLGEECAGVITGSTEVDKRQVILDDFAKGDRHVLVCQIQSGGTGLNIQAASLVIICEPQIKPSLTRQAVARVHRMGQIRGVLVFHMLCQDSIDEAMVRLLEEKQREFDLYADESALSLAEDSLYDSSWIRDFIEKEAARYLPGAGEMGESLLIGGPGEEEVRPDPEKTGPGDLPLIPSQAESPKMLTSEAEIYPPEDYNNDSRD
ncbi:MAG: DEAD/DEAH box helicase, partial [Lachnospiraceae bacterium]|nr:DEAD/DEAH box helicase [Lachnospiraceae bacterium]